MREKSGRAVDVFNQLLDETENKEVISKSIKFSRHCPLTTRTKYDIIYITMR